MKQRGAGILIHVSSLPGRFGIGDLGPSSYRLIDFLSESNLHYWQILPLNPTDPLYDNSPYHCLSAFGTNPLFISPEKMVTDGYLDEEDILTAPTFDLGSVDYKKVIDYKISLFSRAYQRFKTKKTPDFDLFCRTNAWWLDDFSLFFALKKYYHNPWNQWPDNMRLRNPDALQEMTSDLQDEIEAEKFLQFIFYHQWNDLKTYCKDHNVMVIGDLPIYVDYDSVDVWVHPRMFKLDDSLNPITVSGVPPDYFSSTGQLWENPIYNWDYIQSTGYSWWVKRFERNLEFVDLLRVDHFRGLVAYWEVPSGEPNAINGCWKEVPIEGLLSHLMYKIFSLPLIAEDLGIITPDVREIMRKYQIPGMKVLEFAFSSDIAINPHIIHNHEKDCIVYPGTHDNLPVLGWYRDALTQDDKKRLFSYVGREISEAESPWAFIRLAMMSVADIAIIQMQDILGLGTESRMNNPANNKNNWRWRSHQEQYNTETSMALKKLVNLYGRG
jgi:4-alpha-glucanotransferase